jgi:cytochrome c oxidase subunit 2
MRRLSRVLILTIGSLLVSACSSRGEAQETILKVVAKKWDFSPAHIVLHQGVATTLELTSLDRRHGFAVPELGIRVDIKPNETTRLRVVPPKAGRFAFHCDVFCGDGHEGMTGEIVVVP